MIWATTWTTRGAFARDRAQAALARFATNHPEFRVESVGGGRAFKVLGAPGCAPTAELRLHFGVMGNLATDYSLTHRAAGDGVILRNLSAYRRMYG